MLQSISAHVFLKLLVESPVKVSTDNENQANFYISLAIHITSFIFVWKGERYKYYVCLKPVQLVFLYRLGFVVFIHCFRSRMSCPYAHQLMKHVVIFVDAICPSFNPSAIRLALDFG